MPTLQVITLGCSKNTVDTEHLLYQVRNAYEIVPEEEVRPVDVQLINTCGFIGDADAPTSKDSVEDIKALFEKAVPDYDGDRFYVSHMKKVVDWYNELKNYASLDFVEEEEEAAEPEA